MESYYLKRHGSFATPIVIKLDQDEITLGRRETQELRQAPNVSRSHAMFLRSCAGQWFVKDMNSMNGVFLNSVRIGSGLYTVHVGDIIGLGSTSPDSDRDYVFIMCNNRTLPLASSSSAGDRKDHRAESSDLVGEISASNHAGNNVLVSKLVDSKGNGLPVFHTNNTSDNIFGVQIKEEVIEKEPEKSDTEKSENNHVNKTVNHVFVKKEKVETSSDNLCDRVLLNNTAKNVSNSVIHPLLVDSRNYGDKNTMTDTSRKKPSSSLIESRPPDVKNHKHTNISEVPISSSRPSGSVSMKEGEKLCSHRRVQNGNYDVKQFSTLKELKVVLKKYDDIVVESYEIGKRNAKNDSDSSDSDVIIPHKQQNHRLKISSSSSSDESEEPHVAQSHEKFNNTGFSSSAESRAHNGKSRKVSNERREIEIPKDDHNAQLTPEVKSCAAINITSALNTTETRSMCYTQEDEIIIISSDDDDDYDYAKNPVPVKIKTEPMESEDLSNSEWHYVSNSQNEYEHDVKDDNPFDSDIENFPENVPFPDPVLNSSALRTNVTNHRKHVDGGKELDDLQWEHAAKTRGKTNEEELLDMSENIENITKFLNDAGNSKSLPEKTFNGSKSVETVSKTGRSDFFHPSAHSGLPDQLERLDSHVGLQGEEKLQNTMSTNYKKPWLPGNHQRAPYSKVEMESSSKHVEFDIFPRSTHSENEKRHAENSYRSSFSGNYRPECLEEKTGNEKKSSDAVLNDFRRRQKEKTLSKTVLTEAMPIQYRSRSKRGREEWFRDHYEDDKPTKQGKTEKGVEDFSKNKAKKNKDKVVAEQEKTEKGVVDNSKNKAKANSSAVKHKSSRSEHSDAVTKRRRSKHNKSSSLRDQMQSMYFTIPFHSKSSAPVAAPSYNKQTEKSTKHEKNISFLVKRKLPAASEDTSAEAVKEKRTVKRKERFNSRMSFFTEDVVAANTDLQNVDSLRSQKKSEHLTKKSHGKVPSFGSDYNKGIEVPSQEKKTAGDPSVLKISHVPKHNAQTLASPHIHSESSLVSQCSNPQFQTASRHVPTRNSSASQVPSVHQPVSGFGISTANSVDPCFQMMSKSHVAPADLSASGSSAVHAHLTSGSSVPVTSMSTNNNTDPRLQVKISASNSSASQVPSSTKHNKVPVSCSSASQAPGPRFQVGVPAVSVFTSETPDPRFQKFPAENSSTFQHADPRAQVKVSPAGLSTTQISDPRLQAKTLNSPFNSVSHSFAKHAGTSAARASNIGVVVPQKSLHPMCKLTVKLDSETFIVNILSWMPVWLKEQQSMNVPPPLIDWNNIQPLKLCYQSLDDYVLSFYNLILVEMWESLFQAWKEKKPNSDFTFVVTNYSESGNVLNLECMSLLSGSMSHCPVEGTLLIINLRLAENRVLKLFGYTNYCKFRTVSEIAELHTELKKLPEAKEQNPQFCQFKLQVKSKNVSPCLNKRMKGCVLSYISVTRRIVNSLLSLESSPLVKDILCPQEKNCTISNTVHPNMHILKRYNKAQASAIMAISDEMRKVYSVPRILLLQGPPGTGKTRMIIGIIENLLSRKHEKIKILVTAPSNAAADEIGRRLISLRRSQSHANVTPLNFVRVGIPDQIHSDVKPFSLDSLVHATFKKHWNRHIENAKASLSQLETKINDLKAEIKSLQLKNMPHRIIQEKERELSMQERRARHCTNEIEILRNKTVKHSNPSVYRTKLETLKNADVILSTLSSCRQSVLENSFGKKSDVHFTCCIIDEASQCTEPEALQPLTYGMCKLLLVGDHQQLPATVRSRVAIDSHLEKSLFERIHLYFHETLGRSPVYMLTEQYRMHSEICSFPSSHFYSHKLKAAPEVNLKYESFPLKPYIFLNVAYSKESNVQKSKTNVLEAEIVISLCISLVKICPPNCSVGVITPYQGQKRIYETAFSKHSSCRNIEVNTVDSFQGREKDLVVISCVRSHSQDGSIGFLSSQKRLNVAITRAAKCLIICGNAASLEEQPGWTELIRDATSRDLLIPVTSVDDIHYLLRDIRKKMI